MTDRLPTTEQDRLAAQVIELEQKLTFQQLAFDQLNAVVLEQQTELERLRVEFHSLRQLAQNLHDQGAGEDLPHEKPPHY